jgi:L-asparaginase II
MKESMTLSNFIPVAEYTRGPIVESIQIGAAAIVDNQNRLVANLGNPHTVTYPRSSAKPFQVLPLIEDGGTEAFDLTDQEIAIMCASHSGTDKHVAVLQALQPRIGIGTEDLLCGVHPPLNKDSAKALLLRGEEPNPLHENCSGKHTGMLANAKLHNLPKEDYINPEHPLQKTILKTVAEMMDLSVDEIILGTDGCSAPVFAMPLTNVALGFARLCDPADLPKKRANALRHIARAMTAHPDMVAGPERIDTILMRAFEGKIVSKIGAEGYLALGIMPGVISPDSPALGITLKIADGDLTGRARPLVMLEILRQLGVPFTPAQEEALAAFDARPVQNWRKLEVGQIRTCFQLKKA